MLRKIRVLVVEDSLVFRELLVQNLNKDEGIEVVAAARDPFEARDMILKYQPDVMTLDIEMPRMDGIEFLQKLMPQYPMPVVMISSLSDRVFDAMNAGAVDFVAKPTSTERRAIEEFIRTELPVKIKIASIAKIHRRRTHAEVVNALHIQKPTGKCDLIAIGASTGGTEATFDVLQGLHKDVPGIVVVQHMPAGFTASLAQRLDEMSDVQVKEAEDGDIIRRGHVYIAPGGKHLRIVKNGSGHKIQLSDEPAIEGLRPCANIMYESLERCDYDEITCVVLTGMGADGTKGIKGLSDRHKKIYVIAQDEDTSVVYGMPKAIAQTGLVNEVVPLNRVAEVITKNVGVS